MKLVTPSWIKRHGGVAEDLKFSQAVWYFSGQAHFYKGRLTAEWYGQATLSWRKPPDQAFSTEPLADDVLDCRAANLPTEAHQLFNTWFWERVSQAVAERPAMLPRETAWRTWITTERARRQALYQKLSKNTARPRGELRNEAGLNAELFFLPAK